MKMLRLPALIIIALITLSWLSYTGLWKKTSARSLPKISSINKTHKADNNKLLQKATAARRFVSQKGFNNDVCFLIDMSLPSGQNRFFVYDLKKDSILREGLVGHGNCYQYWLEGRRYSNVVGCGCTSLGKYKIGISYIGKFGYSYKLHGLDSTNNNAFERTVVLHSHSCVPETATADEICQSNGCPMVAPGFLQYLKPVINTSKKPVLLWIFE